MDDMKTEQPVQGSAAYNKFKDGESLMKAYKALEAEFTRKSQQLAALQREHEENAAWNAELQDFYNCYPKAKNYSEQIEQGLQAKNRQQLCDAYLKALDARCVTAEQLLADEQFLQSAAQNEDIRSRVISQYLAAVAKGNSPVFAGSGYLPVSPRREAETLDQAGKMAQGLFK